MTGEPDPHDIRAEKQRATAAALAELGLAPAEATLFNVLHFGLSVPPDDLCGRATIRDYAVGGSVTRADAEVALAGCLAKGWLQFVDEPLLARLRGELCREGILGPVYGWPLPGGVDFTAAGADRWQRLCERWGANHFMSFSYTDTVHEKSTHYRVTRSEALAEIERLNEYDDVIAISDPVAIGPWRANWWRRFPKGYRFDVESRRQWQGRCSPGDAFVWFNFPAMPGLAHAQDALDRRNVSLAEWIAMTALERTNEPGDAIHCAGEFAERFGIDLTRTAIADGLKSCVRKGWLRKVSERAVAEVRSLFDADPTNMPVPFERVVWRDGIDFTPTGAQTYRLVSAAIFGSEWEDTLWIEDTYYWEEHHYCATEIGLQAVLGSYEEDGVSPNAVRTISIGPWCVYWWQRYASGYRFELTFCDPNRNHLTT